MTLSERDRIHDRLLAYCDGADRGDVEAIVQCFAADGVADYGPRVGAIGHDDLRTLFTRFLGSNEATSHHLTNVRITIDGDTASATSYISAWHLLRTGDHLTIHGRYVDELVVVDGGWRIARRRLEVHGSDGPAVAFHRLERAH